MQYFLVIKGPADVAERTANQLGVSFTFEAESRNGNEIYGYAPESDRDRIIAWYAKDAGWAAEFNSGSLLWYAERK